MFVTSIVVQAHNNGTARFFLTGKYLVPGQFKLSWYSNDLAKPPGSVTLPFSTLTPASIVSDAIPTSDVQDLFTDAIFVVYQIDPIDFGPPNRIVIPGPVSGRVYLMALTPQSIIPTITWIACDLSSFSTKYAQIFLTGTGFPLGTYFMTFSDDSQNHYSIQLSVDDYGMWTVSSDVIPISTEPSSTGLVYDAVYSDFTIYWDGIQLASQVDSFTAPSANPVIFVTSVTYLQMTVSSFYLGFLTNRPFSGIFEVTFNSPRINPTDGNPPFSKDIELVFPYSAANVEKNTLEIDGTQFRYGTDYTITSFKTKSDQTELLSLPFFFTIPPARPTPIDENSIVDLSGFEDLRCGYGTDQRCLNLIQAIHNQLAIPEMLISHSPLTVKVRNGGIAKEYFDSPVIHDAFSIWGEVDSGVIPTIQIQSKPLIAIDGVSTNSASLALTDLVFDFASEWNDFAFIVAVFGDFSMHRCVITETTNAHGTFFTLWSGDASFHDCEIKDIKAVDTILNFPQLYTSCTINTMKVTNCGQHDSNTLFRFSSGMTSIVKLDMAGCEAEDAPLSLSSFNIYVVFTECSWTECQGWHFAGALSLRPQWQSTIVFHHCRWIDCSVKDASQPTCLYIYRPYVNYITIWMTNLTFVSSDASQTKPYFLMHDVSLGNANLGSFLFDYWTDPNMFLIQSDYHDAQPISSLSPLSYVSTVVAPTRNDELLFGIDSPICGTEERPCATVGRALSHLMVVIGEQPIVSICDGGKAEFGTKIQNATICGEVRKARLVLLRHEVSLDGTPFFTTSQGTIESVVIDHSASTAEVLIKHEQWHLDVSHVRFSTTATTSPTLISASAGTVALRFVSFDSAVFVSSAISIATVAELSIVSLSSFNTSFHSPLLTIRSLDPKMSQASLSGMNVTHFSFGGSNELLIDARQATVLISECHFAGQPFVPSRCNSENPNTNLDLSLSANPLDGYFDSENQSRHPRNRMVSDTKPRFSNSVCVWSEGGVRLEYCVSEISHCSFDSFASTALSLKGGTTLLSHSFFFGNGISSSLPTRRNVLVEIEGNVTIHNMTTEQQLNGLWISSDKSSQIWQLTTDSSERVPFDSVLMFRPVVESASLSGDEDKSEVVIVGESLIPCNLLVVLIATNTTNETSRPIECSDVWTEDGTTLRCSFDDTRMALSSLEWRVSVSCDGFEAWNMPVVRRTIRGDAKAESRGKVLISVSSVVFGVLGVIGVSLIVSIVIVSQKLKKTKATVTELKVQSSTIELRNESRRSRRTHRRSLSRHSRRGSISKSLDSRQSNSSSSSSHESSVLNPIELAILEMKCGQEALDASEMVGKEDEATSDLNDLVEATDPNKTSL
ncbi:hypothetical protein BLNAU_17761 [Blattamonas nauphoetae]|uniref:Uncharacterized protein n=1 Tax=Blattamonas nauphoetae TaxID=2049346 RepID=A0ABQ9X688_9EUKA|nr:hypothetical protein BLNAU_17761 [Blattamonas nauphoetae]